MANIANVKVKQGNILSLSGSSVEITGSTTVSGDLNVLGTITAAELIVNTVTTASTVFTSGSTQFGDDASDTHTFSGSVNITGDLNVVGTLSASVFSGSGAGLTDVIKSVTASTNLTASTLNGAVTIALTSSITGGLVNIKVDNEVSAALGKFITLSASNAEFSGNVLIYGTASLSANPSAAYVRYTGLPLDKIEIFPGLLVSGSSILSGNLNVTGSVSASSFTGSGAGLADLKLSALSGASEGKIIIGSGTTFVTASLFSGSGITINSGTIAGVPFLAITGSATGVTQVSGGANIVIDNTQYPVITASLNTTLTGLVSVTTDTLTVNATASLTGQVRLGITLVTASYSVVDTDNVLMVSSSSPLTITLPTESVPQGRLLIVKNKTDSVETITLDGLVDGQLSYELNGPYQSVTLVADNDEWLVT